MFKLQTKYSVTCMYPAGTLKNVCHRFCTAVSTWCTPYSKAVPSENYENETGL